MRSIQDTLATADECRRAANAQPIEAQRLFYADLQHYLLGIAAIKQWLHDTERVPPPDPTAGC
jgi:hypothetical protein